jgi:hypothetical protein
MRPSQMTAKTVTAAAVIALALAACGTTTKSANNHGSGGSSSKRLGFANCMRAHGVPNFPDPTAGGGGVNLHGTGINPQSPAFKSAHRACAKFAPGGSGPVRATESQFLAAVKLAKCMRAHRYPDFPDPTRTDSPAPILVAGPGLFFHVSPSFDPNTPEVNRAEAACGGQ